MNKHKRLLNISVQYEPNRFAKDSLLSVYEQLKPSFPRTASEDKNEKEITPRSLSKRGHS